MRAFPDANRLISYLLNPEAASPITTFVEMAVVGRFTLLVSEPLLYEFT